MTRDDFEIRLHGTLGHVQIKRKSDNMGMGFFARADLAEAKIVEWIEREEVANG